jgi:serine/threonine-protein kinase
MGHAHRHGVVHRDLKPANVLLTADGTPLIADFGLAKHLETAGPTLSSQVLLGTPAYMAPEQAAGQLKLVGPHTDVHALGAILYELLTGRPPFRGATPLDTLDQVRALEPVPPTRLQPKVPRDLEAVCLKCLHKEPAGRYADGQALVDDLERFLAGRPTEARPAGVMSRAALWCRRPDRIRDAGVVMLSVSAIMMLWMGLGLLAVPFGVVKPEHPSAIIREIITRIVLYLAPAVWVATKVLRRRPWAIWAATGIALMQLLGTLAFFLGTPNDMGGLYNQRDPGMSFAFATLTVMFTAVQFLTVVVGLLAYHANRQTVAWSQQGSP